MKMRSTKIAGPGLVLSFILSLVTAELASAGTITIDLKNTCPYSATTDAEGNLLISCIGSTTTAPTRPSTPTPTPTPAVNSQEAPTCSVTASLSKIQPGGLTTLTANCRPAATSYIWSGSGTNGLPSGSYSITVSPNVTTTYSVKGINNTGIGLSASQTVTVTTPAPVSAVPKNCHIVDITWGSGLDIRGYEWSNPKQYLLNGQMVAYRMKVTEDFGGNHTAGTAYNNVMKQMSVSSSPCDFSPSLAANSCMATGKADTKLYYSRNESSGVCRLPAVGSYVYFNLKNVVRNPASTSISCPAGSGDCSFYFMW